MVWFEKPSSKIVTKSSTSTLYCPKVSITVDEPTVRLVAQQSTNNWLTSNTSIDHLWRGNYRNNKWRVLGFMITADELTKLHLNLAMQKTRYIVPRALLFPLFAIKNLSLLGLYFPGEFRFIFIFLILVNDWPSSTVFIRKSRHSLKSLNV